MNNKTWILVIAGIALLSAAVYLALMLTGNRAGSASARSGSEVILPAEWPPRQSDLEGLVVSVKDNSIFVRPVFKREGGQQDYPQVEVVVARATEIYLDITDRQHPNVVDGKLEFRIEPFALEQIKEGYVLNAWGARRGDRLVADTIIIYVIPSENG